MIRNQPAATFSRIFLALVLVLPLAIAQAFSLDEWKASVEREQDVNRLGELYVEYLLETNPVFGIQIGIHGKEGDPRYYDDRLPEISVEAWASDYETHLFLRNHLAAINASALNRPDQIDLHILKNEVEQQILQVTRLGAMTNPLGYVGSLGQAFNGLVLRDYAPLEQRLRSFAARCAATHGFLNDVRRVLMPPYVQPSAVVKQVTLARLQGMARAGGLFDTTLPQLIEAAGIDEDEGLAIREVCDEAVLHINSFSDWFQAAIVPRPDGEWRLGRELYGAKYQLVMDYPLNPDELLALAEKELERVYGELTKTARKIHDVYLATEIAAGEIGTAPGLADAQVVRNVFARLAKDRSSVDTLIDDSYALADAIVGFVKEKNLMDLPPSSKLRIEDIPPHLAGFAVAQIIAAPAFEPELESVWFWDLGLLATSDSYLKEYNRPTLAMVYIHEGVPGHFVQLEYSNRAERIVPKVFLNGPMVEGWATYIATQLVDEGFTIYPGEPYGRELQQIVDDKLVLRAIINAIIDIKLHTSDWPEEEAVKLMIESGFQEEGEAQGKLTRAKLSSVQLATYFAGHEAIKELLADYRKLKGSEFSLKEFNERLVNAGSPPFFAIRERMLGE